MKRKNAISPVKCLLASMFLFPIRETGVFHLSDRFEHFKVKSLIHQSVESQKHSIGWRNEANVNFEWLKGDSSFTCMIYNCWLRESLRMKVVHKKNIYIQMTVQIIFSWISMCMSGSWSSILIWTLAMKYTVRLFSMRIKLSLPWDSGWIDSNGWICRSTDMRFAFV